MSMPGYMAGLARFWAPHQANGYGMVRVMRIAILEDDISQAELISLWLKTAGHSCYHFQSATDFQKNLVHESYDLVVLDWELPSSSGIEVLKWVRQQLGWDLPVLFTTVRDSETDIVTALEAGADDYINKPLSQTVTLARVNALLRRFSGNRDPEESYEIDNYVVNRKIGKITLDGNNIEMTDREFMLADALFRHLGNIVSRGYILESIWGISAAVDTRTIDTHISRIRQKLKLLPENGWRIKAVYQHGYRLERV
jgi:DNA-binding response OmpR family regulator